MANPPTETSKEKWIQGLKDGNPMPAIYPHLGHGIFTISLAGLELVATWNGVGIPVSIAMAIIGFTVLAIDRRNQGGTE